MDTGDLERFCNAELVKKDRAQRGLTLPRPA